MILLDGQLGSVSGVVEVVELVEVVYSHRISFEFLVFAAEDQTQFLQARGLFRYSCLWYHCCQVDGLMGWLVVRTRPESL